MIKIAVLALQGAFIEHENLLKNLGAECFEIRKAEDLKTPFNGLIIPGGESTVQAKLLRELGLYNPVKSMICGGVPVFGTCAGLINLAAEVRGGGRCFGTMDITAERNAYGRQLGSFCTEDYFNGVKIPMTFIRAPYISRVGAGVRVLAAVDGKIVAARQGNQLVCAFHPELTADPYVHNYFLDMVKKDFPWGKLSASGLKGE